MSSASTPDGLGMVRFFRMVGYGVFALMAIGLIVLVMRRDSSAQTRVVAGLVLIVVGLLVARTVASRRAERRPATPRASTLAGQPATMIPMRPDGLVLIVWIIGGALVLLAIPVVLEPKTGLVLALVFGVPVLSLLPDTVAGLRSRAGLVMSPELVELRAWDRATRFSWDDIEVLDLAASSYGPVLVFVVDESSAVFSTHSTRRIWRFGPQHDDGRYDLPIQLLGADWGDLVTLVFAYRADPGARYRLGEPW